MIGSSVVVFSCMYYISQQFFLLINVKYFLIIRGPLLLEEIPNGLDDELKESASNERKRIERRKQKTNEIVQLQEVEVSNKWKELFVLIIKMSD